MSALADPQVGQYLNRHFVAAVQKVATFKIDGGRKQGGNVAAYFCTPAGLVLHAVAGPVDAATFLREARWANDAYEMSALEGDGADRREAFFHRAHLARLRREPGGQMNPGVRLGADGDAARQIDGLLRTDAAKRLGGQGKVHLALSARPMPPLGQVYRAVFERILNEKISADPVAVAGE